MRGPSDPERVHALVIYSRYARRLWAPDYPWGFRPDQRARYAGQLEQDWAWEADMHRMCPNADDELARWWGERCRAATSPGAARSLIEMASLIDLRDVLGAVRAPTLVLHRRDDIAPHVEAGRNLAQRIPGARFVELEGTDHFVGVDPDQILDPVEDERSGAHIAGDGVAVAQEVAGRAPLGEVWVTSTLRDLSAGSEHSFARRDHLDVPALGRQVELDVVR